MRSIGISLSCPVACYSVLIIFAIWMYIVILTLLFVVDVEVVFYNVYCLVCCLLLKCKLYSSLAVVERAGFCVHESCRDLSGHLVRV